MTSAAYLIPLQRDGCRLHLYHPEVARMIRNAGEPGLCTCISIVTKSKARVGPSGIDKPITATGGCHRDYWGYVGCRGGREKAGCVEKKTSQVNKQFRWINAANGTIFQQHK